jgi:type VI protein secretion system component VasK
MAAGAAMTAAKLKALHDAAIGDLMSGTVNIKCNGVHNANMAELIEAILNNLPAIIEAMEAHERMAEQLAEVTAERDAELNAIKTAALIKPMTTRFAAYAHMFGRLGASLDVIKTMAESGAGDPAEAQRMLKVIARFAEKARMGADKDANALKQQDEWLKKHGVLMPEQEKSK